MSPRGKTSLVAEFPYDLGDQLGSLEDHELINRFSQHLIVIGWIKSSDIIGAAVRRMENAYPVLEIDYKEKIERITRFLSGFNNLSLAGRNGKFVYSSMHDVIKMSKNIIDEYVSI